MRAIATSIFLAWAMHVCAQTPIMQVDKLKDNRRSELELRDSLFRDIDLEMVETGFLL